MTSMRSRKLENILEKRLVGEISPDRYERKAISEFEKKRKSSNTRFIPLAKIE